MLRIEPGIHALCLMPDHVHLLHEREVPLSLARAMSGHTRSINAHRGRVGALLRASPKPEAVAGREKIRRSVRYIHLNPCRARLADDPVAWAFSTHLDALGLAASPARRPSRDPHALHRYVSADPTVHVHGTRVPVPPAGVCTLDRLLAAVSVSTRTPGHLVLENRGPARALFVACARGLSGASSREIAAYAGISPRAVRATTPSAPAAIAALAADSRIDALSDTLLRRKLATYLGRRS